MQHTPRLLESTNSKYPSYGFQLLSSGNSPLPDTESVLRMPKRITCQTYVIAARSKRTLCTYYKRAYAFAVAYANTVHGKPRPSVMRYYNSSLRSGLRCYYRDHPMPSVKYKH